MTPVVGFLHAGDVASSVRILPPPPPAPVAGVSDSASDANTRARSVASVAGVPAPTALRISASVTEVAEVFAVPLHALLREGVQITYRSLTDSYCLQPATA